MLGGRSGVAGAWLRCFHDSEPGAPRLVCLPHAGGSASYFFPLSRRLAPSVGTFAVQYPGRQDRRAQDPITTIAGLADGVVAALADEGGVGGPLILFGHSLGAVVGFEVVRRLEQGAASGSASVPKPAALIVSGRRAPSRQVSENVHLRDNDGVLTELARLGGTDGGLLGDEDLVKMILPALRADYRALADYAAAGGSPEVVGTVACPIVAMVGDADPVTPVDDALAWSEFTAGGFESEVFPGGHFYLSEHQERVTDAVRRVVKAYA
ncbi:alpha/beta fold hydrolase [Catenulispora yoronensis]|uniref:Alpha/beta fold hydrolase n=1 Tax=Catenulispora yoronensis TaxID=450799 RepID=A0ABP5F0A7_9ACTN